MAKSQQAEGEKEQRNTTTEKNPISSTVKLHSASKRTRIKKNVRSFIQGNHAYLDVVLVNRNLLDNSLG